jgi:carbamoyltransferase
MDLKPDGSFWLNMDYFNYCQGLTMTNGRFHKLFGAPPRDSESTIEQLHLDIAASIQAVTEEVVLRVAQHVHKETKQKNLVLAGGVALNCVANGRLLREGPFENIWIQPSAGDAGGALGAAQFVWYQLLENERRAILPDAQKGSLLGPEFSNREIELFLQKEEAPYEHLSDEAELLDVTAKLLAEEKVVGWFNGRMEFGPRALGARSILGDPRSPKMQTNMNVKIKFRESFRPFAPCVLQEYAHEWFGMKPGQESPYMLLVAPVLDGQRLTISEEERERMRSSPNLLERVNVARSTVPAITHVDYSARVQTVDEARNPRFYRLLKAFYARTGCPVLVNTSFNVRGEPIVCTPEDAYRCFLATDMDVLVLGNYVLRKESQKKGIDAAAREKHLAQFELD